MARSADRHAAVVVIGGGMAGTWTAFQLARAGIDTLLVSYESADRGGLQGSSRRSVGALSLAPLTEADLEPFLQQLGRGQTHPSVAPALVRHFSAALEDLRTLMRLKPVKVGCSLESGSGEDFIRRIREQFIELGGQVLDAWVTRLLVDPVRCQGIQYESRAGVGRVRCNALVLAAGGYAGLFKNSIRTHCFGNILGAFLERGGHASNLEFLFKHGYGNVDANQLTPTEELPGAEIYDEAQARVTWLEQLLFQRQGTRTHLQAVQQWLRNPDHEYFVDLSYRPLFLRIERLNALLGGAGARSAGDEWQAARTALVELFPETARTEVGARLDHWSSTPAGITYAGFEELKPLIAVQEIHRFRVRPLTYFSMGGIGHRDFATSLHHTFVAGEAMHDFGANRVGGLPWSLYLAGGRALVEPVLAAAGRTWRPGEDFELDERPAHFDPAVLKAIQQRLHEAQELRFTEERAAHCIDWLRGVRRGLRGDRTQLHDAVTWSITAEAILVSSLQRAESRGFFFREDHQHEDERMNGVLSCAWYDAATDAVQAELLPAGEVLRRCGPPLPSAVPHELHAELR